MRYMTKPIAPSCEIDVDEVFKALSHPARRQILAWLKEPKKHFEQQLLPFENGVCAGRIFDRTELSPSTVSAHLACLQRAGLLSTTKIGQWIFYKRNDALIETFQRHLLEAL